MLPLLLFACSAPDPKPGDDTDTADTDTAGTDTADTGDTASPYEDVFAEVRRATKSAIRSSAATGASVAIWYEGEVIFAEGFGEKHGEGEEPVTPDTLFQIGSDTKKMAALLVLQQVQAGTLSLDDTLADAAPGVVFASDPALAGTLTLHELLSHQSGLYDYTPWVDAPADSDLRERAEGRFAENEFAMGPSGLYWNYCNPNFSLSGLVVEEATGRAWGDVLEEDLFAPLGLTRTFARQADAVADGDYATGTGLGFADGYDTFDPFEAPEYTYGAQPIEAHLDAGFTRPAGLVWSTASDMARFAGFLVDGDPSVIDPALLEALTTPQVAMYPGVDAADFGYGYGLMINNGGWNGYEGYHPGVPIWSHGGNTMTMTSAFYILPEQRVAVAILSNGYGDDFVEPVVAALEGLTDLPTESEAPSILPPPEDQPELAGTYVDPHTVGTLVLTWDGEELLVEAPDLEAAGVTVGNALTPYAKDLYLLRVNGTDYDLSVYRDEDGSVYLVNRQFTWTRSAGEVVRPAPRPALPVSLAPSPPDPRAAFLRLATGARN